MEKLLDALRETLAKLGLDEESINAALQEAVAKAEEPEEKPEEGDPGVPPSDDVVPPAPETDVVEGEGNVPPSAEPNPVEEQPVEGDPVPPESVPDQVEPTVPPVPPFDPSELVAKNDELNGQVVELKNTIEGLLSRIGALEDALKTAGVIDEGNPVTQVGDDNPSAAPTNPTDDVFTSVLNKLNGK